VKVACVVRKIFGLRYQYVLYLLKYEMLLQMRDLYCSVLNFQENTIFTQMQDDFNV